MPNPGSAVGNTAYQCISCSVWYFVAVAGWTFLTNHGRALLCIARDSEVLLRDIAVDLGITERHAYGIVNDLTEAGYVVKEKDGRRNRYQIQEHLPLPEQPGRDQAIGEVLGVLAGRSSRDGER
jgi:DNA-binding transcriptional ArsR family regulator